MPPNEIFISHASQDQPFTNSLVDVLRNHGLPVWYAPTNIIGAQQWHDAIGAALQRCDWFVVVLSPHAAQSMWVKREVFFALNEPRYAERIVPLLYQPCDYGRISWALAFSQFVEFTQDFDDGCRALLRVWGIGYQPPKQ